LFDIQAAFNYALYIKARTMQVYRPVASPAVATQYSIKVGTSNYSRNIQAQEDTVIGGLEFVFSRTDLEKLPIFPLKRGDKIVDVDLGTNTIVEINEMFGNGKILGYRIRTA
jgi:hypothetical protein